MENLKATISTKYALLLMVAACCIPGCKERTAIPSPTVTCDNSSMLAIGDTITLDIDDIMNPIPYVSQLIETDSTSIYVARHDQILQFYDLTHNRKVKQLELEGVSLEGFSGFFVGDTAIYFYSYPTKKLIKTDTLGNVLATLPVASDINAPVDYRALSETPLLVCDGRVLLSGLPLADLCAVPSYPTSVVCDEKQKTFTYGGGYPQWYQDLKVGTNRMWNVFHTMTPEGRTAISLPLSHSVTIYSPSLDSINSIEMPSRYFTAPAPSDDLASDDADKAYFLAQHTYGPILYDPYRRLYYRIATHPYTGSTRGMTLKPFSIIVADESGRLLTETPVFEHDNTMFFDKWYVTKEGLLMQVKSADENQIKFVIFTLQE